MSQPIPAPGIYTDSSGTPYEATRDKKGNWWLKKRGRIRPGSSGPEAYPKPDFEAAVKAGTFTRLLEQI